MASKNHKTWGRKKTNSNQSIISNIIKTSEVAVISKDLNGIIQSWNQGAEKLYGYTKEDVIGKPISIIFPENKLDEVPKILKKIKQGESIENLETVRKTKYGELKNISLTISPINDEKNKIIGASAIGYNITDIKNTEKKIRNKERDWRKAFDSLEDIMLIINKDYKIEKINDKGLDFLGKQREDVVGKKCYKVFHNLDEPADFCPSCKIFSTNSVESTDKFVKVSDKYFSIKCSPIFNENGEIVKFVDIMRDSSFQVENKIKLESSLKEKEILLKELHHRVKNNLQIIYSLFNLQLKHKSGNDIDIIKQSQNRIKMMSLVHGELYSSENCTEIDCQTHFSNLVSYLFKSFNVNLEKIKYKTSFSDNKIDIDVAIPVSLIINELVSNCLEHAFNKNDKGIIEISFNSDDDFYKIVVKDNGKGFPRDIDFRNTETLGLQLVMTLVEQLDGSIILRRENGTIFEIKFQKNIQ